MFVDVVGNNLPSCICHRPEDNKLKFTDAEILSVISVISIWFLGAFAKFRKVNISLVMSVSFSAWNTSTFTGRIFMKFYI